uniref:Uncharacterized protein n=1 Tax=Rhizophora mucronata TaxID=61149 RepID=A0A2P2NXK7_RHIMU
MLSMGHIFTQPHISKLRFSWKLDILWTTNSNCIGAGISNEHNAVFIRLFSHYV